MAFFDDLASQITRVGNSAVQKTQAATEVAKLNGQISADEKRIQSLYTNLGVMYFQKYGEDPDPDFIGICQEISHSQERIAFFRHQILEARSQMLCPSCGAVIDKGATFCGYCGYRMVPNMNEDNQTDNESPSLYCTCGALLSPHQKFCAKCGQKVESLK